MKKLVTVGCECVCGRIILQETSIELNFNYLKSFYILDFAICCSLHMNNVEFAPYKETFLNAYLANLLRPLTSGVRYQ